MTIRNNISSSTRTVSFVCPECSSSLQGGRECDNCGFTVVEQEGIPCFAPSQQTAGSGWLSADELEAFADRVSATSIRNATNDCITGHEHELELLSEIYGRRLDSWIVLVSQYINGTCLEINAGFGRRSTVLGTLAESVYGVDQNLSRLRVLDSRDDCSTETIVPVQTSIDRLPFPKDEFDVIVADFSGENLSAVREYADQLQRYVTDDGTLLVLFDGWTRNMNLIEAIGLDHRPPDEQSESIFGSMQRARPRTIASNLEYDKLISFLPSLRKPKYAFDANDPLATRWAFESAIPDMTGKSLLTKCPDGILPISVLRHCYPGYLAVITDNPRPSEFEFTNPVRIAGRSRSVVVDIAEGKPDAIFKIPNKSNHSPLTERENNIIDQLQSTDSSIRNTLPDGREHPTRFGTARKECPVDGTPLSDHLDGSIDSFRETLQIGLDWLARFQLEYRGSAVVRSPEAVREDLTFEPGDIHPDDISDPVTVFPTPIHGDYMPGNIYIKDGSVNTVIDWEYGALDGNPIVDAGFLVLFVSNMALGSYREGFRTVFGSDTPYSQVAKECVLEYCDAVGLPLETFETYLPLVYIHRLELDWKHNSVSTYDGTMDHRISIVELLTKNLEFVW